MRVQNSPKKLLLILAFGMVFMFGFAFALVPLYNTLCRAWGINGKIEPYAGGFTEAHKNIDQTIARTIDVELIVAQNHVATWDFYPQEHRVAVTPGRSYHTEFYAKNHSDHTITVQAIPSITPTQTAIYMQKTECFCFTQQTLAAGESIAMPVTFIVDPALPEKFSTLTLAYTLYEIEH